MIELTANNDGVLLGIKVVPQSSRTRCVGEWDGRLKIAVAAPPEKGKANKAVITLLAEVLGVPRNRISIARGQSSAQKTIRIELVSVEAVAAALKQARS